MEFVSHATSGDDGTRHNLMVAGEFVGHYDMLDSGELANVYVAPEHRGRGHAATLLAHALRQYRRARIRPYLYCHADNAVALHAYRRAGFCRTNDGPYVKLALPAPADV